MTTKATTARTDAPRIKDIQTTLVNGFAVRWFWYEGVRWWVARDLLVALGYNKGSVKNFCARLTSESRRIEGIGRNCPAICLTEQGVRAAFELSYLRSDVTQLAAQLGIALNFSVEEIEVVPLGKKIRVRIKSDEQLYIGVDVACALGLEREGTATRLSNTLRHHTKKIRTADIRGSYCWDKVSLQEALNRTISPAARIVAKALGFECRLKPEQACLADIYEHFLHLKPYIEYVVGKYRIDLYFSKPYCLAVECDASAHHYYLSRKRYTPQQEAKREATIRKALGCDFVRFNPDKPGFKISDTITEIQSLIDNREISS